MGCGCTERPGRGWPLQDYELIGTVRGCAVPGDGIPAQPKWRDLPEHLEQSVKACERPGTTRKILTQNKGPSRTKEKLELTNPSKE